MNLKRRKCLKINEQIKEKSCSELLIEENSVPYPNEESVNVKRCKESETISIYLSRVGYLMPALSGHPLDIRWQ